MINKFELNVKEALKFLEEQSLENVYAHAGSRESSNSGRKRVKECIKLLKSRLSLK